MKILILLSILIFQMNSFASDDPQIIMDEMIVEIQCITNSMKNQKSVYLAKIKQINWNLENKKMRTKEKVSQLILKDQYQNRINELRLQSNFDISKIRYIKGLQIIRLLYEKVLSLDHHFTAVTTFSEISKIANPHSYPEFEEVNRLIQSKTDKKNTFDLTQILGTNTIVSVANCVSNLFISSLTKPEKESELKKIECIMDFTVRMQNDLNTIFFETAFLNSSNEIIKKDIETLFREYTKPLAYDISLAEFRNKDDGDKLKNLLEQYLKQTEGKEDAEIQKRIIDLEFPIDRLIQFIGQYNNFINEGEKFYKKFGIILNSYENEKQCSSAMQPSYSKLKNDVNNAIDKFNIAYKPIEVNGSKMKEILYGINEYQ